MKTINDLKKGEVLLTTVRKVAGNKYQIELAELIDNPSAQVNVAALLNKSDSRFTQNSQKPRRAWQSAEAAELKAYFGIDVTKLKFQSMETASGKKIEAATVNILNPKIQGMEIHVQIKDSLKPSREGQEPKLSVRANGEKFAFAVQGQYIYSNTSIVAGPAKHTIINSDELVEYTGNVTTSVDSEMSLNG